MTELMIEIVLGTAFYTLIATRTAIVLSRFRTKNYPEDRQIFGSLFLSTVWPATAFMFGFLTIMSGEGLPTVEETSSVSRPNGETP